MEPKVSVQIPGVVMQLQVPSSCRSVHTVRSYQYYIDVYNTSLTYVHIQLLVRTLHSTSVRYLQVTFNYFSKFSYSTPTPLCFESSGVKLAPLTA
jgi:hypothetical protein